MSDRWPEDLIPTNAVRKKRGPFSSQAWMTLTLDPTGTRS